MIDTVNTQADHYSNGCWTTGTGEHVIMVLGSCRMLPFVNYLNRLNADNRFTIALVYVVNFAGNVEQYKDKPILRDMINRCRWFLHEHTENYGFLNTSKDAEENIYQYGMNPEIDVSVPNFNDHMILANDYTDYGVATPENYVEIGEAEVERFCRICEMSSFPEFSGVFRATWRGIRYFWRPNHTSSNFTMTIFALMNHKFLHLDISSELWGEMEKEDLFRTPCTQVTEQDRAAYGLTWK